MPNCNNVGMFGCQLDNQQTLYYSIRLYVGKDDHSKFRQQYFSFFSLFLNFNLVDLCKFFFWGLSLVIAFFDAIEDITIDHLRTLQQVMPSVTCLHIFNRTILHRFEVLLPPLNDCISALGLLNNLPLIGWVLGVCGIAVEILQSFNPILALWLRFLSFVVDPDVLVEVFLTKILNALLSALLTRVHDGLDFIDQSPYAPISRNDSILGIGQHKDEFGSVLVIAADLEILQQEIDGGVDQFLGEYVTILQIGDELGEEVVPVRVYIQGFHVEIDDVDDVLFLLAVHSLPLLLVILKDDGLCLVKGILVVEKGLDQLINAELFSEDKVLQLPKRKQTILESSQVAHQDLYEQCQYTTVLLGNGGMEVGAFYTEIDEDSGDEVVKPFDLANPVDMEDLNGLVQQGQDKSEYFHIVLQDELLVVVLRTDNLNLLGPFLGWNYGMFLQFLSNLSIDGVAIIDDLINIDSLHFLRTLNMSQSAIKVLYLSIKLLHKAVPFHQIPYLLDFNSSIQQLLKLHQ